MFQKYKTLFLQFCKDKWFAFAVALTSILAFAYYVFNFSPNVEDLSFELYYGQNNLLISAGRFGTVVLDKLLGIYTFRPMVMPSLGVLAMIISAILWCCLLKKLSLGSLSRGAYIIFACFFIAAPLINEVLIYTNQSFSVPLCFLLTTIATILIEEWEASRANVYWAIALMVMALAIYESFAVVFIAGILACFIVRKIYGTSTHSNLGVWKRFFLALEVLGCAIFARYFVTGILTTALKPILPRYSEYTTSYIAWFTHPFKKTLNMLLETVWLNYFVYSKLYLPIAIFNGCLVLALILGVFYSIKRRSKLLAVLFFGLIIVNFTLPIFLGQAMHYRACQVFGFFSAFVLMLFAQVISERKWKFIRIIGFSLMFLLLFYQVNDLNKWFFVNNMRYQEDVANFTKIGNDIRDNYPPKPVVFLGNYRYTDRVMQYIGVRSDSSVGKWLIEETDYIPEDRKEKKYILQRCKLLEGTFATWGVITEGLDFDVLYDPNYFVFEFLRNLGYTFSEGGEHLYKARQVVTTTTPMFPNSGYITDCGDFLVVNFGV